MLPKPMTSCPVCGLCLLEFTSCYSHLKTTAAHAPTCCAVEAWRGSVHDYAPTVQDSGIERLMVEFSSSPGTYGAHGSDQGFNAIFLLAASNVWVKQVSPAK